MFWGGNPWRTRVIHGVLVINGHSHMQHKALQGACLFKMRGSSIINIRPIIPGRSSSAESKETKGCTMARSDGPQLSRRLKHDPTRKKRIVQGFRTSAYAVYASLIKSGRILFLYSLLMFNHQKEAHVAPHTNLTTGQKRCLHDVKPPIEPVPWSMQCNSMKRSVTTSWCIAENFEVHIDSMNCFYWAKQADPGVLEFQSCSANATLAWSKKNSLSILAILGRKTPEFVDDGSKAMANWSPGSMQQEFQLKITSMGSKRLSELWTCAVLRGFYSSLGSLGSWSHVRQRLFENWKCHLKKNDKGKKLPTSHNWRVPSGTKCPVYWSI